MGGSRVPATVHNSKGGPMNMVVVVVVDGMVVVLEIIQRVIQWVVVVVVLGMSGAVYSVRPSRVISQNLQISQMSTTHQESGIVE